MIVNKKKNQQGNAVIKILLGLAIGLFVITYSVQIGLGFFEKYEITNIVKNILDEDIENKSSNIIKSEIEKKLSVTTLDISNSNIVVEKSGKNVLVMIEHSKEIKINDRIKIVLDLSIEEEV